MAERLLNTFLRCHVCSETFRDPVSLSCHHSFCSSCLHKFWGQANKKNCPVCRRKSSKNEPGVNFSLKELADSYTGTDEAGSSEDGRETYVPEEGGEVVCSKHTEEPKWFCEVEQRAVCHVCEDPAHHRHTVVPLEQAVKDLKEQLKSDLETLQDKRYKCNDIEEAYNEVVQYSEGQLEATERQIGAEFETLHQFLKEEEKARLAALREEKEEKGKIIAREKKSIQDQISSLTESISAVEQDLKKQELSFLNSYKHTQMSIRDQSSLPNPQVVSGALIDVAKHLGNLTFRVWEKMKEIVKYSPVVLDPNTVSCWLSLSDDLTSVSYSSQRQQLPDNPERTQYATVFGSEGFSSGKHSWDVNVGNHPHWDVGVAKESVDRKGMIHASPNYGIWAIVLRSGEYTDGKGNTLTLKGRPQKIRVQLDYNRGEVSFYGAEDMTHIYTHKDTFTETLYPYFSIVG